LTQDLTSCKIAVAGDLRAALDDIVAASRREHERTRQQAKGHFDSAVRSLEESRVARDDSQAQLQQLEKTKMQLLNSLRFDEMFARQNRIGASFANTLQWIFDESKPHEWDSFVKWLRDDGENVYWIAGKAGSGKSTLVRFIVNDSRTEDALRVWSKNRGCTILAFYFWPYGSKMQRCLEGLLCPFLVQIIDAKPAILEEIQQRRHHSLRQKLAIHDRSLPDLKRLFNETISLLAEHSNICIFLDGVDEFDQDEDVSELQDLIEQTSGHFGFKFCISSRPEPHLEQRFFQYPKLQLQYLRKTDMQIVIDGRLEQELGSAHRKRSASEVKQNIKDQIKEALLETAQGVSFGFTSP
jgi:AAA ATPase domain